MRTIHYVISDVFFSDPPERISSVIVRDVDMVVTSNGIVPAPSINEFQWTREDVADAIDSGKVFYTAVGNRFGAKIETYGSDENGVPYIRTVGNGTIQDNLGYLDSIDKHMNRFAHVIEWRLSVH